LEPGFVLERTAHPFQNGGPPHCSITGAQGRMWIGVIVEESLKAGLFPFFRPLILAKIWLAPHY